MYGNTNSNNTIITTTSTIYWAKELTKISGPTEGFLGAQTAKRYQGCHRRRLNASPQYRYKVNKKLNLF